MARPRTARNPVKRVHLLRGLERVAGHGQRVPVAECGRFGGDLAMTTDETLSTCPRCRRDDGRRRPRIKRPTPGGLSIVKESTK